ncbi:hypothetical protein ACOBV8_20480 (plasmid) [Pseudoalteromonas espejiana]
MALTDLVTGGLADGDKVIVEGLQKIRPGAPVSPSKFHRLQQPTKRNNGEF